MSTRLDRLILLLDTGSTQQIKSTAAKQLGEIGGKIFGERVKPEEGEGEDGSSGLGVGLDQEEEWKEVMGLVGRILPHLRSKSYDTRSAASLALASLARSIPIWTPPPSSSSLSLPPSDSSSTLPSPPSPPPPFDLPSLLLPSRPKLLASSGKEFAMAGGPTTHEEIEEGKREVMKRLGIGGGPMDMGFGELVKEELGESEQLLHPGDASVVKMEEQEQQHHGPSSSEEVVVDKAKGAGGGKAPNKSALKRAEKERMEEEKRKELEEGEFAGLSARQVNAMKRKRKMGGGGGGPSPSFGSAVPVATKPRLDAPPPPSTSTTTAPSSSTPPLASDPTSTSSNPLSAPVIIDPQAKAAANAAASAASGGAVDGEGKLEWGKALVVQRDEAGRERWPWERVVEFLQVGLFSPSWEIRHGAALGLRDLLKSQGKAMGMVVGYPTTLNSQFSSHSLLLLAQSLLTLLALDRFGDYNSDVVVAPVRETASQTLAAVMKHMSSESVAEVHRVLVGMVGQSWLSSSSSSVEGGVGGGKSLGYAWEVRHAGLLGLKFEVAVRGDLVEGGDEVVVGGDVKMEEEGESKRDILKDVVDAAVLGLGDADDDVRSVSAACLLPVANYLATRLPEELARVVAVLWDALSEGGDELGSSTGGVMDLLGKLIAFPQCIDLLKSGPLSLVDLVPRLFPFFRHTITNVRLAVPNALHLFLTTPSIQSIDWIDSRLFRFLFQNILVEERLDIREASARTWRAAIDKIRTSLSREDSARFFDDAIKTFIGEWLSLAMSPPGVVLDSNLFLKATVASTKVGKTGRTGDAQSVSHNVDKNMMAQDLSLTSVEEVIKCRLAAAQAFSLLMVDTASQDFQGVFTQFISDYLGSTSAHQIILAAVLVEEWSKAVDASSPSSSSHLLTPLPETNPHAQLLATNLIAMLEGQTPPAYYEMLIILSQAHSECQNLLAAFVSEGKVPANVVPTLPSSLDAAGPPADLFSVGIAGQVAGPTFDALVQRLPKSTAKLVLPGLRERQMKIVSSIGYYLSMKDKHDRQVSAAVASAVIALRVMPTKLNPVIRSIMNGVKFEENLDLQRRFAHSVSSFIAFCSSPTSPVKSNPTDKIIKNLSAFICQDSSKTPIFVNSKTLLDGILTLKEQSSANSASTKDGRTKEVPVVDSEEVAQSRITSRGAQLALAELAERFGERLFVEVPKLWSCMTSILTETFAADSSDADAKLSLSDQLGQETVDTFTTLSTVVAHLHPSLHSQITDLFPFILVALQSKFSIVRQAASKVISSICDVATVEGMKNVVDSVLPFLGDPTVAKRQGAVEVVSQIVRILDVKALPYVLFMIVPILGRMSDPDDDVRLLATSTFASLVKMVPLEAGIPDPPGFSAEMLEKRAGERQFLNQLLDGTKVDQYEIPVPIKAELRKYQQDGINWLAFLAKYQLHGILCDDMGLGKSLQSLCILAGKHYERAERFKATGSPDSVHLPSIIVCPPTLTGHWYYEILKFTENLRPVVYVGSLKQRSLLQESLTSFDVVITSYEMVRNDIDFLGTVNWNYCILDEGHVIKNGKTKLTKAVKMLRADHRLILSGTPIQNNVLELWSLFDFLMPGFLGTERSFNERFGKPITAVRDGKATAREREASALALEALHKQVLPFLLRRLKEDVLSDLPPKIIQDYYCDLSDVQKQLYDDFSHSGAVDEVGEVVKSDGGGKGQTHVFQSLQYLRKLCNHPCLVAKESEYKSIVAKVKKAGGSAGPNSIRDLENAPKLMALKQILLDCGIGNSISSAPSEVDDLALSAVPQHRVLIFCQLKTMLDVIENDLFRSNMPSISYMRMDGSTDPSKRHGVVQTFNSDPSIDVLLLTTQVGGLGLNLTGADTVIFVEHDWNPMKDLQAMDRAHRLGQKKVVNVYRLITKGTLEEKIMGLQRFKLNIANSIVNQQNSGLESMGTDQVLDLFKISTGEEDTAAAARRKAEESSSGGPISQKNLLDGLEDLPEEEEYSGLGVDSFLESM